jgi:hypothetical protein
MSLTYQTTPGLNTVKASAFGIWHLLDIFNQSGVPASCTINAKTALEREEIVAAIKDCGWEIVAHDYEHGELLCKYADDPEIAMADFGEFSDLLGFEEVRKFQERWGGAKRENSALPFSSAEDFVAYWPISNL